MNLTALKDKLADQLSELWNRIQESSLFMSLREKYEGLSSRVQKIIVFVGCATLVLFILSFPYAYISSSQEHLSSFEDTRGLIRELLKAAKTLKEPSPLPPEMPENFLATEISHALDEFRLVPEQMGGVVPIPEKITTLVPDAVKQIGFAVNIKKINLRQFVEISHKLQSLGSGIKMIGLDIHENEAASHYFDVIYRIANFSVPPAAVPVSGGTKGKAKKTQSEDEE